MYTLFIRPYNVEIRIIIVILTEERTEKKKIIIFLSKDGRVSRGGIGPNPTKYDYFGGERKIWGSGTTSAYETRVETWSVTDEKPSYPMSDSASRIRQNASMEIDVAISHENCKFEYFCHYTRFDYNVRLFISPGEK